MAVAPHLWTVASRFKKPPTPPEALAWRRTVTDPTLGEVTLSGLLREEPGASELVVFVHGIGGCASARYAQRVAATAAELGLSCFRLNLRGCDRRGGDYYHAGLSSDLAWALSSPELSKYQRIFLLGYSMGGHIALHYASRRDAHEPDPRVVAVGAVCSPLDLTRGFSGDRPGRPPGLTDGMCLATSKKSTPPSPPPGRCRCHRSWRPASPPCGSGTNTWWRPVGDLPGPRTITSGPVSRRICPAWRYRRCCWLPSRIHWFPPRRSAPPPSEPPECSETRWVRSGGHVGFSSALDLGFGGRPGLEGQMLGWLMSQT